LVEETSHWFTIGLIEVSTDVDLGDFIVSGGTVTVRPVLRQPLTSMGMDEKSPF
jgi:hypothetical protein